MAAGSSFRNLINQVHQPSPYFPIATELKGAANLVIGTLQFLASYYMYSQSPHYNALTAGYFRMGVQAVRQGAIEFVPGALATYGAAYAANRYNVTASNIISTILSLKNREV